MKKFLTFILLFLFSVFYGEVIEIFSIAEAQKYIDKDTLVILDIDNTLMEPKQAIGSDQWFYHRIGFYKSQGLDFNTSLSKTYDEWHKLQTITDVQTVEESTSQIVSQIQNKTDTIALTTRGFQLSYATVRDLESLAITFTKKPYILENIFFDTPDEGGIFPGVLFFKGILFTNNTHKGEALFKLLDKAEKKPKKIVFINDKKSHIDPIEASAKERNIPFIGLRYGYTDQKATNLDMKLINISSFDFNDFIREKEKTALLLK